MQPIEAILTVLQWVCALGLAVVCVGVAVTTGMMWYKALKGPTDGGE